MDYSGEDRRRYSRHDLECPVVLLQEKSEVLARTKTINVSDGGALVPMFASAMPECGKKVHVRFSVPRSTPNSYMLEGFSSEATIVRHHTEGDDEVSCIGLEFDPPLNLAIEV